MAKNDVKLLGVWASPFVMRARVSLNIKSVNYEFLEETTGSKSELLLQSNPVHKKVPVLIHGDKPIYKSLVIVQYINEVWTSSPSILSADHYDRAIQWFWATYLDDMVQVFCLINYFPLINISVILSLVIIIIRARAHPKLHLTCVAINLYFCIELEHCICVCVCVCVCGAIEKGEQIYNWQ